MRFHGALFCESLGINWNILISFQIPSLCLDYLFGYYQFFVCIKYNLLKESISEQTMGSFRIVLKRIYIEEIDI